MLSSLFNKEKHERIRGATYFGIEKLPITSEVPHLFPPEQGGSQFPESADYSDGPSRVNRESADTRSYNLIAAKIRKNEFDVFRKRGTTMYY